MIKPFPFAWRWPAKSRGSTPRAARIRRTLAFIAIGILSSIALFGLYLTVLILRIRATLPSITRIASFAPAEGTKIYSRDGVLLAKLQIENRKVVPLKDISRYLVDGTLAIEDKRFYSHRGLDYHGIARAAFSNLFGGETQGGSTITQQLARNIDEFGIGRKRTLERKLREAIAAMRIEQVFTKDEILEMYLNQIYFGSGAYGVEAAARTYFGKSANKLSLGEASLLAGLPRRPQGYSPFENLPAALDRRKVVLEAMRDSGKITPADQEAAEREPVKLIKPTPHNQTYKAPYFVDWVVQQLAAKYGQDRLYSGWKIVTTLDWRMQEAAERAVKNGLSYDATQGALVCLDPHTGEVVAMVGGVDHDKDQFNVITQGRRQPGSAFKPIVYAAAFDTGAFSLDSQVMDARLELPISPHKTWTVHNYTGEYSNRDRSLREAIANSINSIAVQVAMTTGLGTIVQYARGLGLTGAMEAYPSLALGAAAVNPLELCSAYSVFAACGDRYSPTGMSQVVDNHGQTVFQDDPVRRGQPVSLKSETIMQINEALRGVVLYGTGAPAREIRNAFGKTGTTSSRRDVWFIGYTPDLVAAVWAAHPVRNKKGVVTYAVMSGATGGRVTAPIWTRFMSRAAPVQRLWNSHHGRSYDIPIPPPPPPAPPAEHLNAQLASASLPAATPALNPPAAGYFHRSNVTNRSENQPLGGLGQPDREYISTVRVCADSGKLATEWCPTTVLMRGPISQLPREQCTLHGPPSDSDSRGEPDH